MNLLEDELPLCSAFDVCTFFNIRRSTPDDAEGILHAHYSAVHETAKTDYPGQVLNVWSGPIDAQRIADRRMKIETDKSVISFVAVDEVGKVFGFGELVFPETLGAIYVAASAGRRGVASALFNILEAEARQLGIKVLRMESSLTAVPFYVKHGFRELQPRTHRLTDRLTMTCVFMEKKL